MVNEETNVDEGERIKRLEELYESAVGFLSREKPREYFGDELDLSKLAFTIGITLKFIPELSDSQAEAKSFGYSSLDKMNLAYQEALSHYHPVSLREALERITA